MPPLSVSTVRRMAYGMFELYLPLTIGLFKIYFVFNLRETAKLWWQSSVVGSSGLSQHVLVTENREPVG